MLVALPHLRGVRVLYDEDWVVNMGASDEELMNSFLLWQCSWLLSILYNAHVPVIWRYLDVPHDTNNSQCHTTT